MHGVFMLQIIPILYGNLLNVTEVHALFNIVTFQWLVYL